MRYSREELAKHVWLRRLTLVLMWSIPVLYFVAVIALSSLYAFIGQITLREWDVFRIASLLSLIAWCTAVVLRTWLSTAHTRISKYEEWISNMESTTNEDPANNIGKGKLAKYKERHSRLLARSRKLDGSHLLMLRISYALILFELIFIFYLEVFYRFIAK